MLTTEEIKDIETEAAHYPKREAVCIDALKIVQRRRGWVSDESLRDIATHLGMSPTDLDSVATFYNLIFRRPVGRHVIMVCDSVSCWIMGHDRIREHLSQRLGIGFGETTPDNRYTL
jgi:NADH-quinone oxidoreductase subunit E